MKQRITRRGLLKAAVRLGIGGSVSGLTALGWSTKVEPEWLEISNTSLPIARLDRAFNGLRIAQLSDIHMDPWMTRQRLEQVVQLVNAQQPDIVCITGDFVTYDLEYYAPHLVETLGKLQAKVAKCAVLGNHDHWTDPTVMRGVIHDSGLIDLNNEVHTIQRGNALLHLAGVDDAWVGNPRIDIVTPKLTPGAAAVLLCHEPDFADQHSALGCFDLQLSGHSHGGQVTLPGVGPLHLPPFCSKYPSGLYRVGQMWQYTNRGLGMIAPYVRFNCRPEIAMISLRVAQNSNAASMG